MNDSFEQIALSYEKKPSVKKNYHTELVDMEAFFKEKLESEKRRSAVDTFLSAHPDVCWDPCPLCREWDHKVREICYKGALDEIENRLALLVYPHPERIKGCSIE